MQRMDSDGLMQELVLQSFIKMDHTNDTKSLWPQGEWIDKGEIVPLEVHRYQCSNCKKDELMLPHRKKNYCPNCGASMKGAGENETRKSY